MHCFRFSFVILLLLACVASVAAQDVPSGNWDFGVWAAGATGEENTNSFGEAQIVTGGVFVGKVLTHEIGSGWRRGRFEYAFQLVPFFRQLRPQRIYGGGFEPVVLRWNSGLRAGRVAPYIELGGGAMRTNSNFPAGNTSNFNFTARGGGGIQVFSGGRSSLDIGCRWWHLSNANLGPRNPEFNGIQFGVGYHWFR